MCFLIVLVQLSVCSTLFCLTNAVPAGGRDKKVSNRVSSPIVKFTSEENKFILEEICSQTSKNFKIISWVEIAKAHESKVNNRVPGFTKKRTAEQLKYRFQYAWKHKDGFWKRRFVTRFHGYSEQEEEFINKELLSNSYRFCHLNSDLIWKDILQKHDVKRKQKCDGFSTKRSVGGLNKHFMYSMRPAGKASQEVRDRYSRYFKRRGGGTIGTPQTHPETVKMENTETISEGDEVWDTILDDLEHIQNTVDEHGVDHTLFLDRRYTTLFSQNSPYVSIADSFQPEYAKDPRN